MHKTIFSIELFWREYIPLGNQTSRLKDHSRYFRKAMKDLPVPIVGMPIFISQGGFDIFTQVKSVSLQMGKHLPEYSAQLLLVSLKSKAEYYRAAKCLLSLNWIPYR